jgi:hypothetical protein
MNMKVLSPIEPTTAFAANEHIQTDVNNISVSVSKLKQQHVTFALPMYGGLCYESCLLSFIEWGGMASKLGLDWSIITLSNESLIPRARNTMVSKFLIDHPESTHLMFIDADIGWKPEHVIAMLNRDVDVIGGLYPMKTMPVKWCVNGIDAVATSDGLEEVSKTGTGFMLIKKHVFETLKQHKDVVNYNNDTGLEEKYNKELYSYFDTIIRDSRYLSEDWKFCDDYRSLGGKVYVDKRVLLRHSGTYVFCHEEEEALTKVLGLKFLEAVKEKFNLRLIDEQGKTVQLTP